MAEPFIGEIRIFGGNFAPVGWELCNGQLLSIAQYDVLFNLIGTTYGGDGQNTFALPDMRGRIPVHQGSGRIIGEAAGVEQVTLTVNQIPVHTHPFIGAATTGNQISPSGNLPANSLNVTPYINESPDGSFNNAAIAPAGGNQPHENTMPFLCLNYIIALEGLYPSPN